MDRYRWTQVGLAEALEVFIGSTRQTKTKEAFEVVMTACQCQMETKMGDVYRGQVRSVLISREKRNIIVALEWFCIQRAIFDGQQVLRERWFPVPQPEKGSHCLNMDYGVYYIQKDEGRVKVKGSGEFCRFYRGDDYTNLVRYEDEFVPYCKLHRREFCQAIVAILMKRQQCPPKRVAIRH